MSDILKTFFGPIVYIYIVVMCNYNKLWENVDVFVALLFSFALFHTTSISVVW